MTLARAHIRVCDAYGNRKAAVTLEGTYYELGSDLARAAAPDYILLSGSGVAPRDVAFASWRRAGDRQVRTG